MPYCPKCKSEYRKGFEQCTDCQVNLVDQLPAEHTEIPDDYTMLEYIFTRHPAPSDEALLTTTESVVDFSYVASILEEENIAYRVVHPDKAPHITAYMGVDYIGSRIFVSQSDLERAKEIIEAIQQVPNPYDY